MPTSLDHSTESSRQWMERGPGPPMCNPRIIRGVSITHVLLGGIILIMEVVSLIPVIEQRDAMTYIGSGIWSGMFFMFTGIVGIRAAFQRDLAISRRHSYFVAFLVLSIFSVILAAGLLVFNGVSWSIWNINNSTDPKYLIVMRCITLGLYFTQAVLFIVSIGLCWCNMTGSGGNMSGYVVYSESPTNGASTILFPSFHSVGQSRRSSTYGTILSTVNPETRRFSDCSSQTD